MMKVMLRRMILMLLCLAGVFWQKAAATYSFPCNSKAPFVYNTNIKGRVGYINALNILTNLPQDLVITDPHSGQTRSVVGVMENVSWNGGELDPITISAVVSSAAANQLRLAQVLNNGLPSTFTVSWETWNYDDETQAWFPEFYPGTIFVEPPLSVTSNLAVGHFLEVAENAYPIALNIDIDLYDIQLVLQPPASMQAVTVAMGANRKSVKLWGVASFAG